MTRAATTGWTAAIIALVAGVVAVVLWSLLPRAADSAPESVTLGELRFAPAPGWNQLATGADQRHQSAITANVPLRDPPGVAHADATVQDLPATAIVITASTYALDADDEGFPTRTLPLSITDADVRHSFEGQPNPDVPEYLLWQRVNGLLLDVRVFFGSQHPPPSVVAEAQAALDRLLVPSRAS